MKDKVLSKAMARFERCQEAESERRELAREDIRFADGDQWPEDVSNEREADGRPALVINRIPAFIRQVINDMRQVRPSIKVRPTDDDGDPETAEMLNGMIRAIESASNAEAAYDWAGEYAVRMGWGFWRISTDYEDDYSFDQCISIDRVRDHFQVWMDPLTEQADGSDMKYCFVSKFMDKEEFEEMYPDAVGEWPSAEEDHYDNWFTQDTVRVAEYWTVDEIPTVKTLMSDGTILDGEFTDDQMEELTVRSNLGEDVVVPIATRKGVNREVKQRIMVAHKVLEETTWPGKYIPIVRVLGEELVIDGDTKLKGMVRDMSDPQRQYNYMRTASVERVALAPKAPYVGAEGSFDDPKWSQANKKNYAFLEYKPIPGQPPPRREPPPDISPGLANEVQVCAEELRAVTGIHDPALGNQSNEVSGTAINARKVQSDISNFHYVDNLARAMRYTAKILLDLIPKIYTGERVVNILHGDGNEEKVTLGKPYTDDKGREKSYDLTVGKYDGTIDIGPNYATQRAEASEGMLEFGRIYPESLPVIGDLLAKSMAWPDSDEVAKRLQTMLPPEVLQDESPQIAAIVQQAQQANQQSQAVIGELQKQIQQLNMMVLNKERDHQAKMAEVQRKYAEMEMKYEQEASKIGADLMKSGIQQTRNTEPGGNQG